MVLYNTIKTLIEEHKLEQAREALASSASSIVPSDRYYLEGLLCAKSADWMGAKNKFLAAVALDAQSPAQSALEMISDIYDFYYKDNLNT